MPSALSIAPSQYWEGNDGPWSTFSIEIGTQPQSFHVLPATSQSSTWVVLEAGCPSTAPSDCANLRGGIFDPDPSSDASFQLQKPQDGLPYFQLPFDSEASLNYSANAEVGFDTLVLGWSGTNAPQNLQSQVIAGYAAPVPWLGILGIRGIPNHIFNYTSQQNSPLESLKANGNIPSLYYGYTAGAQYQNPPTFGSLTLGGYDAARIDMSNALTLPFQGTSIDLSVWVNHIKIGSQIIDGLDNGVLALIDSLVPEIWLPLTACEAFEKTLGIVWNSSAQMYLVNSTQHANLVAQNPNITFFLGVEQNSQNSTAITLPYAAFDLTAKYPLAGISDDSSLKYFPLKRGNSTTGYYLGRTFLQEAYLAADYEKNQLTVGPALFPSSQSKTNIVTIDYSTAKSGLSSGALAGIIVGAIAGFALILGLLFWLWWRRRQYYIRKAAETNRIRAPPSVGDTTLAPDTEMDEQEQREHRLNEYFKPGPIFPAPEDEAYMKPELDATQTATGLRVQQQTERHELDTDPVRPGANRSQVSWGSVGSVISPMSNEERVRSLELSEHSPDLGSVSSSPPMLAHGHGRQFSSESSPGLYEMQ